MPNQKTRFIIQFRNSAPDFKKSHTNEFHIAGKIREKYQFDDEFFTITGNVILANFPAVRKFTVKYNLNKADHEKVGNGLVNGVGLLDEIYHFVLREYEKSANPGVFSRAIDHLGKKLGKKKLDRVILEFSEVFPSVEVFKGVKTNKQYLEEFTEGRSNKEIVLEELILLHFANFNPAAKKMLELFSEDYLSEKESYGKALAVLDGFFKTEPAFGPDNQDIFTMLKTPIMNHPEDIESQLDFILKRWEIIIKDKFSRRILTGKDLIKEDRRFEWGGGGGAPTIVPKYKGLLDDADFLSIGKSGYKYASMSYLDYEEPEQFTQDIHWMPNVVMIAKNSLVWLDQLSKKYERHIHRLDQVPDEELDELASWNINSLWLIGVWERSRASQTIKQIMGNPDAAPSAYSLYDYEIAHEIGGYEAYKNLNERARARGIRLASDMVPNHTGIYSKWVVEHPHYFIQSYHSPFPNYTFSGVNLSDDPNVEVRIEDGYWRRSDASVVFHRYDRRNGDSRFIYHGNDGTNMPWNDTAQLNMLLPEVREAVIQKIFEVARMFSIIRFDAAMTLAKKHFQRLWYPHPGTGGDIPSRADYAMTREEFDAVFPKEFWREVVDRINEEMPETLLLAEAFWLMEGYFVRTLGMHRVYNSAFMHMLMNEENSKYRDLITNTLEFEPEILKRYVNFMSNPDEETAIKQFGTDDKYFGTCMLMITLPGLPMLAHGQVEGYTEKYGMEFKKAYYNESPNQWLVERHKREIFPILKKRYLFSEIYNFWFFDFHDNIGYINENVYAYTNVYRNERALVFYNNKYDSAFGRIKYSAPKLVNTGNGNKEIQTRSLADSLNIKNDYKHFYIFREHISGLEFIRSGDELHNDGFYVELGGFKYLIFWEFREVFDENGEFRNLRNKLGGNGTNSIAGMLYEERLRPVHEAVENVVDEKTLQTFIDEIVLKEKKTDGLSGNIRFMVNRFGQLINLLNERYQLHADVNIAVNDLEESLLAIKDLRSTLKQALSQDMYHRYVDAEKVLPIGADWNYKETSALYLCWFMVYEIKKIFKDKEPVNQYNFFDQLMLDKPVYNIFRKTGMGDAEYNKEMLILRTLIESGSRILKIEEVLPPFANEKNPSERYLTAERVKSISALVEIPYVKTLLGVNEWQGVVYYSKENLDDLFDWILAVTLVNYLSLEKDEVQDKSVMNEYIISSYYLRDYLKELSAKSDYKLEVFLKNLGRKA